MTCEITKSAVRYRYPWDALELKDTFIIPADNIPGCVNSRQLCYMATRASLKKGENKKFKSFKQDDGSVLISRIQ